MFNEIFNNFIKTNNINIDIKKKMKSEFENLSTNGDKYKWCKILSKDTSNGKNKKYYQDLLEMLEQYHSVIISDTLDVDKMDEGKLVTRKEISTMSNCGNVQWGILSDDINKKIFIAINLKKPYEYPDNKGNVEKIYNKINDDGTVKCFIQAIKGELNPLENKKNRKVTLCDGNKEGYTLHLFIKDDENSKEFKYFGQYIVNNIGKEKINNNSYAYFFIFCKNNINEKEKEKCSYNVFTKLNKFLDEEINELVQKNIITEEEKNALVKVRINQSSYRNKLLIRYDHCPLTGIIDKKLLIASHIKPYSQSKNEEKYDIDNGIMLSPLADKLFDKFLITFDSNGNIIFSKNLLPDDIEKIKRHFINTSIKIYNQNMLSFLKYHNEIFYKNQNNVI